MRIVVSGASGLIGSALCQRFEADGHHVARLVRRRPEPGRDELPWNPEGGQLQAADLEGCDAVVHLAGESIAGGRWTRARRERLWESRVRGTGLLCATLAQLARPPRVLVSASAVGYYGSRGDEPVDEQAGPGPGFLADLVQAWEERTRPAAEGSIRVVLARFGVVLSAAGGALARQVPVFRLGLGGRLGSGDQYVSWVALDDAVRAVCYALTHPSLSGPVNVVAPHPVRNAEFTEALARVLNRPAALSVPAWVLRLALGQLADEVLLAGACARPAQLLDSGFEFLHPELEPALRRLLGGEPQHG